MLRCATVLMRGDLNPTELPSQSEHARLEHTTAALSETMEQLALAKVDAAADTVSML